MWVRQGVSPTCKDGCGSCYRWLKAALYEHGVSAATKSKCEIALLKLPKIVSKSRIRSEL